MSHLTIIMVHVTESHFNRYLDEIQHPMDFGTIATKVERRKYDTMEAFSKDIERVFSNCRQFNPPATYPYDCADAVERVYKKEWPKAIERKLSYTEKTGLRGVLTALAKEPM